MDLKIILGLVTVTIRGCPMEQETKATVWGNGFCNAELLYTFSVNHPPSVWSTTGGPGFNSEIYALIKHAITTGIFDRRTFSVFTYYPGFIPTFEEVDGVKTYISIDALELRRKPIVMTTLFSIPIPVAILRKMKTIKNIEKDIGEYTKDDLPGFITD